jgi:hypothetical protein
MVNWDDPDIIRWKDDARELQQEYLDLLGDREWDVIEKCDWTVFRRKVGFGMYGPPSSLPSHDNNDTGYAKDQVDQIEKVCVQLVDGFDFHNGDIHFACVFVVGRIFADRITVPVFKAKSSEDGGSPGVYVDTCARKYNSWSDYLEKNKLPKCIYCYPKCGKYERNNDGRVEVGFGTSPACDFINRVASFMDGATTVLSLGATVVGVLAITPFVPVAPILASSAFCTVSAGVGAYGVARSSYALYDRATHGQSVGLSDADARACWISIVGSSLGFAQARMVNSMTNAARAGEVMSKAGRIAFIVVQSGSSRPGRASGQSRKKRFNCVGLVSVQRISAVLHQCSH